jgi:cyclomaltodextrinase
MARNIFNDIIRRRPFLGIEKERRLMGSMPGLRSPAWVEEGPVYEIFVRNFSKTGNFTGVKEKIPYLKQLGIKTIWLMPVHPIGKEDRKGKLGSPYAIRDHLALNPEYGNKNDLRELVRAVHSAGMRIIIDLVINHGAKDHVLTRSLPGAFMQDKNGNFTRKIADWSDVIDFDYSRKETRTYMFDVVLYWIREFDLDGYRCDVAGMVPLDFWEEATERILHLKPDLFMLAEWQRPALHVKSFHATYDWVTYLILKDIYRGDRPAADIMKWLKQRKTLYPINSRPLGFVENHDFPRTLKVFGKNSFYPFVAMIFAMPGIPLIYNGQEQGAPKLISLFDKDSVQWDDQNSQVFNFYRDIIRLRRENKALASEEMEIVRNDHPEHAVTFIKSSPGNRVLGMINFGSRRQEIEINFPALYHKHNWQDLLNSGMIKTGKELKRVDLKPYGFLFWKEI